MQQIMDQRPRRLIVLIDHIIPLRHIAIQLRVLQGSKEHLLEAALWKGYRGMCHAYGWRLRIEQHSGGGYVHRKCLIVCGQLLQMIVVRLQIGEENVLQDQIMVKRLGLKLIPPPTHIKLSRQSELGGRVEQLHEHVRRTVEHHTALALDALPHDAIIVVLLVFADTHHIVVHVAQLQQILQTSRRLG